MSRSAAVAFALILLAVCATPSMANIVTNGSFENPQISGNFYQVVNAGDPFITGWLVGLTSVDVVQGASWAEDGTQGIDMAGTPGPGSLSQTLATTAGDTYSLTFWVSSNVGPYTGAMTVNWNGVALGTVDSPAQGTWNEVTYSVTGTGSDTLAFVGLISTDYGALLDNVNVGEVPEPATFGLIGAAFLLAALRFRRRSC